MKGHGKTRAGRQEVAVHVVRHDDARRQHRREAARHVPGLAALQADPGVDGDAGAHLQGEDLGVLEGLANSAGLRRGLLRGPRLRDMAQEELRGAHRLHAGARRGLAPHQEGNRCQP